MLILFVATAKHMSQYFLFKCNDKFFLYRNILKSKSTPLAFPFFAHLGIHLWLVMTEVNSAHTTITEILTPLKTKTETKILLQNSKSMYLVKHLTKQKNKNFCLTALTRCRTLGSKFNSMAPGISSCNDRCSR